MAEFRAKDGSDLNQIEVAEGVLPVREDGSLDLEDLDPAVRRGVEVSLLRHPLLDVVDETAYVREEDPAEDSVEANGEEDEAAADAGLEDWS